MSEVFQYLVGTEEEDGISAIWAVLDPQGVGVADSADQSETFIQRPEYCRVEFTRSTINANLGSIQSSISVIKINIQNDWHQNSCEHWSDLWNYKQWLHESNEPN